jgi:hypothetical protein
LSEKIISLKNIDPNISRSATAESHAHNSEGQRQNLGNNIDKTQSDNVGNASLEKFKN